MRLRRVAARDWCYLVGGVLRIGRCESCNLCGQTKQAWGVSVTLGEAEGVVSVCAFCLLNCFLALLLSEELIPEEDEE